VAAGGDGTLNAVLLRDSRIGTRHRGKLQHFVTTPGGPGPCRT
jgi:hypothetical protein